MDPKCNLCVTLVQFIQLHFRFISLSFIQVYFIQLHFSFSSLFYILSLVHLVAFLVQLTQLHFNLAYLVTPQCGTTFFTCVPTQWRYLFLLVKKQFWKSQSRHLFYFILKRENKIRKKTLTKITPKFQKSMSSKKTRVLVKGSGYLLRRYL